MRNLWWRHSEYVGEDQDEHEVPLLTGSSGSSELRVLFAFDPKRRAIMLAAGDKSGNWKKWYRENIPIADARFTEHLAQAKKTENEKTEGK